MIRIKGYNLGGYSSNSFFLFLPKDMFLLTLEREGGRERERNINWLPPVCTQNGD